ncbi:MAG: protease inhibitor I42 family protein [Phycisphaerae bacterium]|nr:protease inhibitor I42 family protein [Phycisphaerae bacterium]
MAVAIALAFVCALPGCAAHAIHAADGIATVEVPAPVSAPISAPKSSAARETSESKSVALCVTDRLVVRLGASAGTGYAWQLAGPAPAVLTANGEPVTRSDSALAGGPQWTEFTFTAISQGEGTLRFVLRRPWEPAADHARLVDVAVTVSPAAADAPAHNQP